MTNDLPPALTIGECKISAKRDGDIVVAVLAGSADMRAMKGLTDWLLELHTVARKKRVAEVQIDVRGLEFMNSSCFKSFVTWINTVREEPAGYRVTFVSNPSLYRQSRSLPTLKLFAADLISIV